MRVFSLKKMPASIIILFTATFIAFTSNIPLWSILTTDDNTSFLVLLELQLAIFLLVSGILWVLLSFFLNHKLLKSVAIILLITVAIVNYFNQEMKVVFHLDMIRNIVENIKDHNTNEALELVSAPLLVHLFFYGLLPSALVILVPLSETTWKKEAIHRTVGLATIAFFFTLVILPDIDTIKEYGREHRNLRVYVNPVYTFMSVIDYLKQQDRFDANAFMVLGSDAHQQKGSPKRTVGILFVGETARADHFSLNGYHRKTNPLLEKIELINFPETTACGTSTKFSVPCMFSLLERKQYSPEIAATQSNVLDVLEQAGVKTLWIDNNSSCKGVCTRIENINIRQHPSKDLPYYGHGEYFDEVLLHQIEDRIRSTDKDMLIVLHLLGSHGPAYYKRVPEGFAIFTPQCTKKSYQQCKSNDEFINEYDNTLVYTDFVLNKAIGILRRHEGEFNSFMVYASDHGESLGEKGMYLHGAAYESAPPAQTHIPFLAWLSDSYRKTQQLDLKDLQQQAKSPHSHDNLSHSLLGLFNVKTSIYNSDLDAFTVKHQG